MQGVDDDLLEVVALTLRSHLFPGCVRPLRSLVHALPSSTCSLQYESGVLYGL